MKFIKKYWKDLSIGFAVLSSVFFAVMGWHFSEVANTPFWWNFWAGLAIVCIVWICVAWAILYSRGPRR